MQGLFVDGHRPKSKKQVKETVAADPTRVRLEATSLFDNEYDGVVTQMPEGKGVPFVGPDPYHRRDFYGTIERRGDKITVK